MKTLTAFSVLLIATTVFASRKTPTTPCHKIPANPRAKAAAVAQGCGKTYVVDSRGSFVSCLPLGAIISNHQCR